MVRTGAILLFALVALGACGAPDQEVAEGAESTPPATEASEEAVALPFHLPVPEGWRTETIPFPLEFAPELPYTGLEELRFASGMMEAGSEEFWTYAFVWWVEPGTAANSPDVDTERVAAHLEAYYRGLAEAVAADREFEIGEARFAVTLEKGLYNSMSGTAETLDPFVTREQITLNLRGDVWDCPSQGHRVYYFELSPQPREHAVWSTLASIQSGFRCDAADGAL